MSAGSRPDTKLGVIDSDRCLGLLLGLAAGDRNGGPVQMALALAEQLVASGVYDPVATFAAYDAWWDEGRGVDAWDTGPTTCELLEQHRRSSASRTTLKLLEERSQFLDRRLHGKTAGVNAAHRVAPLALAGFIHTGSALIDAARQESRLTHWSAISQHTCAVVATLCRHLVRGTSWSESIGMITAAGEELSPDLPMLMKHIVGGFRGDLSITAGGFCPEVLAASIRFVSQASSFGEALEPALKFAGPDNYCPVLVGALAGARFGASEIFERHTVHCQPGVRDRCASAMQGLLSTWI